jgi:Na+-driven multidrug efflux pump
MRATVTFRDAILFFLPLIFMTELNMISKSVIHASLARLDDPTAILAAFSLSFAFYYAVTGATDTATLLSLSYLRQRRSIAHLLCFFFALLALPVGITQLVAWTPLGAWLYGDVFGAGEVVTRLAQRATFWFALSAPVLLIRALAFAMIMLHRRTILITLSTLLRLLSLGGSLLLLPRWLEGPSVGAAALVTCMAVETVFSTAVAWPYFSRLPRGEAALPRYRELWAFSWPLILHQSTEMGLVMTINVFLGRLAQPELALASFGVVQGLANVLLSPLRNLVQAGQTLARTRQDVRVLMRFAGWLGGFFTLLVGGVFFSPLGDRVLQGVMGLTPELAAYSAPAAMLAFLVAGFWAYAALFRGLLAGARRTHTIAVSALVRIALVIGLGAITLLRPDINGAVFGILVWGFTFAVETLILGSRLRRRGGAAAPLFPEEGEGAEEGKEDKEGKEGKAPREKAPGSAAAAGEAGQAAGADR